MAVLQRCKLPPGLAADGSLLKAGLEWKRACLHILYTTTTWSTSTEVFQHGVWLLCCYRPFLILLTHATLRQSLFFLSWLWLFVRGVLNSTHPPYWCTGYSHDIPVLTRGRRPSPSPCLSRRLQRQTSMMLAPPTPSGNQTH